ncbi:DNA-binding response regulator, partial [Acinetobacter baumannii]
ILTARGAWNEKVQGIDAGADDYLAKPFSMEELLARIRALIRRAKGHATAEIVCGGVTLDTRTGRVSVGGELVELTAYEYRVL